MNRRPLHYSLLSFLLFISIACYPQETNTNGVDGYVDINEAILHPNEAVKISISSKPNQIQLFITNIASFKNLSAFKIKDATSENGWNDLFVALSHCSTLREIELTFNDIKTIPTSIGSIKNLEKLTVWGSPELNYSDLCKSLSGSEKLSTLELNSNGLETVPTEIKLLQHLKTFTITDNATTNYTDLVEKLSALPQLQNLSLEVNSLTELPSNITKLTNLTKLNISNNFISSLPENMNAMNKLDTLRADGNLFVNYVDEFNKLKGINISYLSVDGALTEEEKSQLLQLFPKAKVDEKISEEAPVTKTTATQDLFQPLVPAAEVPKNNYQVNAANGGKLTYASGTEIDIPKDAFVDTNNNPVKGDVEVTYREFSNPLDIALSGIPMDFSNGNVSYPMQSAGMFQINATQNGKPVYLKKGSNVVVSLASPDSASNYNLYQVDDKTKNWNDLGKQGTIKLAKPSDKKSDSAQATSGISAYSVAWLRYRKMVLEEDTTLFNTRFYDSTYCSTEKYNFFIDSKKIYTRYLKVSRYKKENGLCKKPKKEETWFNVANYIIERRRNPELQAFGNMTWVYDGPETQKEFLRKYIRKKRYSDVRIEKVGESFIIHLKEQHGIVDIPAHPINKYIGSLEKVQKTYDRRYKNYQKALARRERNFNRNLNRNTRYNSKITWNRLRPIMVSKEKALTYNDWMVYYNALLKNSPDSLEQARSEMNYLSWNATPYRRNLNITSFGYFNCDCPASILLAAPLMPIAALELLIKGGYKLIRDPKLFANINVAYTDKNGKTIKPAYVMVFDKRQNSVNNVGTGVSMRLAVNSKKNLIAVMADGTFGLFSDEDFENVKLRDGDNYTFGLKIYNQKELPLLRESLRF